MTKLSAESQIEKVSLHKLRYRNKTYFNEVVCFEVHECGVHHVMDIVDIEFDEPYDEPVFSNESSYQYDIDYFTKEINAVLKEHGLDYKVSKIEYVGATEFVVEDVDTFELEEDSMFDCMPDCYDAPDWTW